MPTGRPPSTTGTALTRFSTSSRAISTTGVSRAAAGADALTCINEAGRLAQSAALFHRNLRGPQVDTSAKLDAILRQAIGPVPGVVAMATTGGETIYEGAFGTSNLATGAPMRLDSVFGLASMTKALTSAGAMQLVEQGKLTLDGPIADILPELAAPRVLEGFSDAGIPVLRPAAGPITLRHLLTHSAGYGYDTWNVEIGQWMAHAGVLRMPRNSSELAAMPLLFDPGTRWNYGINTDIAGKAMEAATGQRLDHYLREALFGPLRMTDTTATPTDAQRARLAHPHQRDADGTLRPLDHRFGGPPGWGIGGGGLLGTGRDYLRFIRMILNKGNLDGARVLWPRSIGAMSRNGLGDGIRVTPMRSTQPAISNDAEFLPGSRKSWSTAFMVNEEASATGRNPGSLAWAGIANTYFWIDPTADVGGVVLMQIFPFADGPALDLFAAFERAVYGSI